MQDLGDRTFGTLSEGERKRVQIARSLMADPELLLLDEPGAGLDLGGREDLVHILSVLADDSEQSPAIVLVSHHVEEIPPGFTHALLMRDGQGGVVRADRRRDHRAHAVGDVRDAVVVTRTAGRYTAPLGGHAATSADRSAGRATVQYMDWLS